MILEETRNRLEQEINSVKSLIDDAEVKLQTQNEWTDPALYRQWKKELREKTTELHQLNRKIKQQNRENSDSLYNFRKNARLILNEDTFNQIEEMSHGDSERLEEGSYR